jgi:hypothetical protein
MRLLDNRDGLLFTLPPPNVILLAPKRIARDLSALLRRKAQPRTRELTVHPRDGAPTTFTWVETPSGWLRQK